MSQEETEIDIEKGASIIIPTGASRSEQMIGLGDINPQSNCLRKSLHEIHQEGADAKERKKLQVMRSHKDSPVNFDIATSCGAPGLTNGCQNNKLLGQCVGLFQVVDALPHFFNIEHLVSGRTYDVHASRLKFYADADFNAKGEILELISSQKMMLGAESLKEHRFNQLEALGVMVWSSNN